MDGAISPDRSHCIQSNLHSPVSSEPAYTLFPSLVGYFAWPMPHPDKFGSERMSGPEPSDDARSSGTWELHSLSGHVATHPATPCARANAKGPSEKDSIHSDRGQTPALDVWDLHLSLTTHVVHSDLTLGKHEIPTSVREG